MPHRLFWTALVLVFALITACASNESKQTSEQSRPAPPGTPLAQILPDMSELQVRKLLGEPDDANGYITGKNFIPFYHGSDTSRTDWIYNGQGRIVFSRNRYSGNLKVVRVDYDPDERK